MTSDSCISFIYHCRYKLCSILVYNTLSIFPITPEFLAIQKNIYSKRLFNLMYYWYLLIFWNEMAYLLGNFNIRFRLLWVNYLFFIFIYYTYCLFLWKKYFLFILFMFFYNFTKFVMFWWNLFFLLEYKLKSMDNFKIIYKLFVDENIKWELFFYSPILLIYYNIYEIVKIYL